MVNCNFDWLPLVTIQWFKQSGKLKEFFPNPIENPFRPIKCNQHLIESELIDDAVCVLIDVIR